MLITFYKPTTGGPVGEEFGYTQGAAFSSGTGIGGSTSLRTTAAMTNSLNNGIYLGFARQHRTGTCGVWSNTTVAGSSGSALIEVWQGDAVAGIRPNGTGLEVWTVNGGVLHTEAGAITASTFKRFDMQWTVSSLDSTNNLNYDGSIQVKVNLTTVFTASNIQLGFAMLPGYTRDVHWNVVVVNPHGDLDKCYLTDDSGTMNTGYLPDNVAIYTSFASPGNGTFTEMTPSTGSDHGAMVDDTSADGDTTYLSVSGAAKKNTFNHADFSSIGSQHVYGLKQVANAMKMEPGYRRFRPLAYVQAREYFASVDYDLGVGYFDWCQHVWETNPHTGQRWTVAQINSSEFGGLIG